MFRRFSFGLAVPTRSFAFLGLLFCGAPAPGAQSLRLVPGFYGSATVPSAAPYATLGSTRFEFRIHDWSRPMGAYAWVVTQTGFTAQLAGDSDTLRIADEIDTFSEGWLKSLNLNISGRTDFVVRAQRDTVNKRWTAEIWNADGSGYQVQSRAIVTVNNGTWGGDLIIPIQWAPFPNLDLAYLRWYEGVVALNSAPPHGSSGGDLGDWEFEGNGNDSSGHHLNLTFHGSTVAYTTTPDYPPSASIYSATSLRAGYPAQLDASRSYSSGGGSLSYQWQQLSGPSRVQWSTRSNVTPTITGLTFGTYTFQVTVTDQSGQSGMASVDIGAVASNDDGVVAIGDPTVDKLLGPMLMYGLSPWPWFDDRHKAVADAFGGWLSTDNGFKDEWNDPLSGTISVTNGSAIVTGTGTTFQTDFCFGAGNTSPIGSLFVVWYPAGGGVFGRRDYNVAACGSQTQLTLANAYNASQGTTGGLNYALWQCLGCWINGSTNNNYYDNVLGYYALYYTTGLLKHRNYARTLADRWWTMPYIDMGMSFNPSRWLTPRAKSITGLVLRALDGRPEMWTGLHTFMDKSAEGIVTSSNIFDIRENAYDVSVVALGALFDPNSAKRAQYTSALEAAITNKWKPQQKPTGQWSNLTFGYASWNGYAGTVSITNGSKTVIGAGTQWQADWFSGNPPFWIPEDPIAYNATFVSATEVTLDRNYEGLTRSGAGWQTSNLVGNGTQPFMMGVVGSAWYLAYQALEAAGSGQAAAARKFVLDSADWITNYGYSPTAKGLYYGRDFPNCEPISDSKPGCGASGEDARYLNSEVINTFSKAYLLTGATAYKTQGDKLFGAVWGKDGGPETDGIFVSEYADGGWTFQSKKAKNFGFAFGFGMGSGWPAARLGVVQPPTVRPVTVSFASQGVPQATQARVTLLKPDGTSVVRTCTASPCSIMTDVAQGNYLMRLEYLSSSGIALSSGDWSPVAVQ